MELVPWTLQQKWRKREKEGEEHKLKRPTQVEVLKRVLCAFFISIPSRPSGVLRLLHWRVLLGTSESEAAVVNSSHPNPRVTVSSLQSSSKPSDSLYLNT